MKTILSLRKHHLAARVSMFLVAVALIAGMASCVGQSFDLTITSTTGGSVTDPGEATFNYFKGLRVDLIARPDVGYRFVAWTGDTDDIEDALAERTAIIMNENCSIEANFAPYISMVAGGGYHTVGLQSDGKVVAVGHDDPYGQCSGVTDWADITQVAAGEYHTVGLKSDGTVRAVGKNSDHQCEVDTWTKIIQVAAGSDYTVGVCSNGTVVAVGSNSSGQLPGNDWTEIKQVAAGYEHTVGVRLDGTVLAVGSNYSGQLAVQDWTDIKQVAVGRNHTVGLTNDWKAVAVGSNFYGQSNVSTWPTVKQVAAGAYHTVGIKLSTNLLICRGDIYYGQCAVGGPEWNNIMYIAAGYFHTVAIRWDGTALAAGRNNHGQCNVTTWTLG